MLDDEKSTTSKNNGLMGKIIYSILVIFVAIIALAFFGVFDTNKNFNSIQPEIKDFSKGTDSKGEKIDITDDLYDIYYEIEDAGSDLQKQEFFKKYKDRSFRGIVVVSRIGKEIQGYIPVTIGDADRLVGIIYFESSKYKPQLLNVEEYDEIEFEGKFKDFSTFTGLIFSDAKFIRVLI